MEQLCTVRNQVGESPLWSVAEQAMYWVDMAAQRIHRFAWADRSEQSWATPERVACVASHADGPVFVTRPGVCGIPETPFNPRVH